MASRNPCKLGTYDTIFFTFIKALEHATISHNFFWIPPCHLKKKKKKKRRAKKEKKDAYKFGLKFGNMNHFSASWGEAFSSSAISKELSTVFSNHIAIKLNPTCSRFNEK